MIDCAFLNNAVETVFHRGENAPDVPFGTVRDGNGNELDETALPAMQPERDE